MTTKRRRGRLGCMFARKLLVETAAVKPKNRNFLIIFTSHSSLKTIPNFP
jgi:hypothetical protein